MKKLIFAFALLCAFTMTSCIENDEKQDTNTEVEQADETPAEPEVLSVTGVAVDGAMNSVSIQVSEDSTIDFSYPDLESEHRDSWNINDTLTVKYIPTEYGDSVIEVINENE